jgi:exonuclease SbcC
MVEVDSYFCRKYIIDPEQLEFELRGLPFIPISILSAISDRPVSAQTFLVKHGMSADLSRSITLPGVKGTERIIEECQQNNLSRMNWVEHSGSHFLDSIPEQSISEVRLKSIEITAFRAYRGTRKLNIDADIIVLFGPNGFGKTSFFDAVDFACTGGVTRFDDRFGRDNSRLFEVLKNLASSLEDCCVKARFSFNNRDALLERNLKDRSNAIFNGIKQNRTKTLLNLAAISEEANDIRIQNLIHLFRATHLFGQDYQSLTSKFRERSILEEDTISRMLAFQDYVQAAQKTNQVKDELEKRLEEKHRILEDLRSDLSIKYAHFNEIKRTEESIFEPEYISGRLAKISEQIKFLELSEDIILKLDVESIHACRAAITGRIKSIEDNLLQANQLSYEFQEYLESGSRVKDISLILNNIRKSLESVNDSLFKIQNQLSDSTGKMKGFRLIESQSQIEKNNLEWLLVVQPNFNSTKQKLSLVCSEQEKTNQKSKDTHAKITELVSENESLTAKTLNNDHAIAEVIKRREEFTKLLSEVKDWLFCLDRKAQIEIMLKDVEVNISNLQNDINLNKNSQAMILNEEEAINQKLISLTESQSELQGILESLEKYVVGGECPVCGTIHDSKEELINRITKRRGFESDELKQTRREYKSLLTSHDNVDIIISNDEKKLHSLLLDRDSLRSELIVLNSKLDDFDRKLLLLDIKVNRTNYESVITDKLNEIDSQLEARNNLASVLAENVGMMETAISKATEEQIVTIQNSKRLSSDIDDLKSSIENILSQASKRDISLELDPEFINKRLNELNTILINNSSEINKVSIEISEKEKELNSLESQKHNLQTQIEELESQRKKYLRFLNDVNNLAVILSMNPVLDKITIAEKLQLLESQLNALNNVRNDLLNLETAINSSESSATVARMQIEIETTENKINEETNSIEALNRLSEYFSLVKESVHNLRTEILEKYMGSYGPLASSIQKRLRSVYGFGDINLHVLPEGIAVEVDRVGSTKLLPSDYFSESQMQIAMLSIFLSSNLTQNWSRFSPILLDDPVQHFDDLNSYALVGLIKRLVGKPNIKRQFIISTCDERLFKLMRQNFKNTECSLICYRFISIGDDGPIIQEV